MLRYLSPSDSSLPKRVIGLYLLRLYLQLILCTILLMVSNNCNLIQVVSYHSRVQQSRGRDPTNASWPLYFTQSTTVCKSRTLTRKDSVLPTANHNHLQTHSQSQMTNHKSFFHWYVFLIPYLILSISSGSLVYTVSFLVVKASKTYRP